MFWFDLLYFQGRSIFAMIEQIIGLLFEVKERGCRTEKLISQLQSALVDLSATVNEQRKDIRHLQLQLAVAEDAEPTFAAPFASWNLLVDQISHKDPGLQLVDCCPISAKGAVYRVQCCN